MIGILLLLSYIVNTISQPNQNYVTYCNEYQLVLDYYNPSQYYQICTECQQGYLLSFDLSQCIRNDQNYFNSQFCKRLGRDKMCEEALCAIQIDENGKYLSTKNGHPNENCARVDSKTGDCLYPRFNYSLNKITKIISKDTTTFCAIREDQVCLEYFSLFIPTDSSQSTFLSNFVNPEQISNIKSLNNNVMCQDDYELLYQQGNQQLLYGCLIKNYQIENCQQYNIYQRKCIKCNEGYSLNTGKNECKQINNCSNHNNIGQCIYCNNFYYPLNGKCMKIENCELFEFSYQQCAYCKFPYYGEYCQYINKNMTDECILLNRQGLCVECKNNQNNFYHKYENQCQPRILSKKCKQVNPVSDTCLNLECQDGYVINMQYLSNPNIYYRLYYFGFNKDNHCNNTSIQTTIENQWFDRLYFNFKVSLTVAYDYYYTIQNYHLQAQQQCIERTQQIDNCLNYDPCFESCLACKEGFQLQQRQDILTQFYYRFICLEVEPTKIEHCISKNAFIDECLQCDDYYTNYVSYCQLGTVANCKKYNNYNQCNQCEDNYVLQYNQCFYIEFCSSYTIQYSNVYCTKCLQIPGVFIALVKSSNNLRQDCVQNLPTNPCSYIIDEVCIQCSAGYVLIEGTNTCMKEIEIGEFCYKANSTFECISCISGYRLVNGKCFKVSGSCSLRYSCTSSSCEINCLGIYQDSCQYNCLDNQINRDNYCQDCGQLFNYHCQKCTPQQCLKCDEGYVYKDYNDNFIQCLVQCQNGNYAYNLKDCPCLDSDCQSCDSDKKDVCNECKPPKYLQENKCVESCSAGYLSYQYYQYWSYYNHCYKCQDNCEQCYYSPQTNNCQQCKEGWFLENGNCVEKCSKFQDNGICTDKCDKFVLDNNCISQCPNLFYWDMSIYQGQCVDKCPDLLFQQSDSSKECSSNCLIGYTQDKNQNKCIQCQIQNCELCSQDIQKCERCKLGTYLEDGRCKLICYNNILVDNFNDCPKCDFYCLSCDEFTKCNQCAQNMINKNGKCECPQDQGYYIQFPNKCTKCQIENCQQCTEMGGQQYCILCNSGYNLLNSTPSTPDKIETRCVQQCPEGYYSQNGYCKQCEYNCLQCTSNGCTKCIDGFIPAAVYSPITQCIFQCPNGIKQVDPISCDCLVPNCIKCSFSNMLYCQQCEFPYYLDNGKCIYNQQNQQYCGNNCQYCDSTIASCKECVTGFINVNGKCFFKCQNGDLQYDQTKCTTSTLCYVNNCYQCDQSNPNICLICLAGQYLANSQCYTNCPEGFYLDTTNVCKPCNPLCKTCSSSDKCDTCKITSATSYDCLCPAGQKLYKNQCVLNCPFHSTLIGDNFCIEDCIDGLYPVYTANKEQRLCQKVEDVNSTYCLQNIENIPDLLSFKLQEFKQSDTNYFITITISQTPSLCYSFQMKGKDENLFETKIMSEDVENTNYQVTIPKDAKENKQLDCTDFKCTMLLQVYYTEQLQYIVQLSLDFDIQIILNNGINYSGSFQTVIGVCPTCVIPTQLIIPSKIKVECSNNQNCSSDSISTTTNSQITITQSIDDSIFQNNKLSPHSLKLEYTLSNGTKNTLFITNYFYDNSVIGQITYTFKAISLKSGNLIVTSVCKSANKVNGRILASATTENVVYPQIQLALNLSEEKSTKLDSKNSSNVEKDPESENSFPLLYILLVSFSFIIILVLIFIAYKCYTRKQQQKLKEEKYKDSQSINKIDDESQNKQIIQDKSVNIDLSLQQQTFDLKN